MAARCCGLKVNADDVGEVVDAENVDEPAWRRRLAAWKRQTVLPLPIIEDFAAGLGDRGDGVALDASAADDPAEHAADYEDQEDQSADAEAEIATPVGSCWFGGHLGVNERSRAGG